MIYYLLYVSRLDMSNNCLAYSIYAINSSCLGSLADILILIAYPNPGMIYCLLELGRLNVRKMF